MNTENNEQYVKQRHPKAVCIGPINLYWPGQGERTKHIVLESPVMSGPIGEGDTAEEAWANAAKRIDQMESGAYL